MRKSMPSVDGYLCGVRRREFRVVSAARGSPFSGFFLAVSDDFVVFGVSGRGFGVRLASIGCFYRPAAFYRPGNCGARFVPRFTQNQHMSALVAERLHPPSLSRVQSTLQIAAHDGFPASWSSPWREHGHSDHPSMETHSFCSAFDGCAKIHCVTRIRPL